MRTISLWFLLAGASACGSHGAAGITMQATSSSPLSNGGTRLALEDASRGDYTLSAAKIHLRDIVLDFPDGATCADFAARELAGTNCDRSDPANAGDGSGEDKVRIAGPLVIDLVAGTSTPSLADVRIPAGTYKRIDFRIEDGRPEEGVVAAGSELDRRSFVARADFTYASQARVLELSLSFNEDARFEQPNGIEVEAGADTLVVLLDAADWLVGLDVSTCLDNGDLDFTGNLLHIDESTGGSGACADIETAIKNNIKASGQLDDHDDTSDS